ncbi:RNA polymerase sigma-70 factor [Compostibacter hankyongensis]|uniref:RNA polymerase sigma-70 factor n=1 Tax=Compostibacter hankyongensis TaxID=1007089 RepID=A0ABP8G3C9_9BACT
MTPLTHQSEEELTRLLQEGNIYAYELIFRRYYVGLCGFAIRFVQEPEAAEEIVQGIFMKLWEKRETINIDTSLKSYLFRSTFNHCSNHLSHIKIRNNYISRIRESLLRDEYLSDPVMDSLAYKELNDKITAAIEELPASCRQIFKMSRFDGLKYAEIAAQLDISVKTIETQISRALIRLRRSLQEFLINA